MQHLRRLILALALLAWPCAAEAQTEQPEVLKQMTASTLERLLESIKIDYQEVKPGVYRFKLTGYTVLLFNTGDNLQFFASFKLKKKLTFGRINEWNGTNLGRFSRAYLDKEGDPCLESDFDVSGGVTRGAMAIFFKKWIENLRRFTQHIDFN